jgi:hypothetical protein
MVAPHGVYSDVDHGDGGALRAPSFAPGREPGLRSLKPVKY